MLTALEAPNGGSDGCAMLRHGWQTVAMELAATLHHSRDARPNVTHNASRGQTTASSGTRPGVLKEPVAQEAAVTVGFVAAAGPLLAQPPGWWRHPGHGGCAVSPGAVSP